MVCNIRMIDANYARDKLLFGEAYISDELAVYINRLFEELPTIEAEPVKRGRWIEWYPPKHMILTGEEMLFCCSNCTAKYADKENMHYCPNCGAKMESEE